MPRTAKVWALMTAVAVVATAGGMLIILRATEFPGDPHWLRVEMTTDKEDYLAGEPVGMVVRLSNPGNRPVTLEFRSSCRAHFYVFELNVTEEKLIPVSGELFPVCALELSSLTIAPGGEEEFAHAWGQRNYSGEQVQGGIYVVHAIVTSEVRYSAVAVFRVRSA